MIASWAYFLCIKIDTESRGQCDGVKHQWLSRYEHVVGCCGDDRGAVAKNLRRKSLWVLSAYRLAKKKKKRKRTEVEGEVISNFNVESHGRQMIGLAKIASRAASGTNFIINRPDDM